MADMVLTDITTDFDPERDQDVNPLLWEIRRERRVELMGERKEKMTNMCRVMRKTCA